MAELKINVRNFDSEILHSDRPCLVDFWADWCMPCKMLAPIIEEIAEEHPDLKVGKINVDEEPELANQFGIMSIPTLIVFKNGAVVKKSVGVIPKESILELV